MAIQFCIIRNKETASLLCNSYEHHPGYSYSEYTRESSYTSINKIFQPINVLFGAQESLDGYTLVIFENKDAAQAVINSDFGSYTDEYEILSFAEIDAIVEAHLLGDVHENNSI